MDKVKMIPKGAIIQLTSGKWEDYGPIGLYRALVDIDVDIMRKAYEEANQHVSEDKKSFENIIKSEIRDDKKLFEKIKYFEIWVDGISSSSEFDFREGDNWIDDE